MDSFKFSYPPLELAKALEKVKEKHIDRAKAIKRGFDHKKIEAIVEKVNNLKENEIERFAYSSKIEDVFIVAYCFANETYRMDSYNASSVLDFRMNNKIFKLVYENFQKYYTDASNCSYFKRLFSKANENNVIRIETAQMKFLIEALDRDNLLEFLLRRTSRTYASLTEMYGSFNFNPNLRLAIDCKKYIYIYCDKKYYLKSDKISIIEVMESYSQNEIRGFAKNYLGKLMMNEFEAIIMEQLHSSIGSPENHKYKYYWDGIDEKSRQKYKKWFNLQNIQNMFGDDERSVFWKRYVDSMVDSKVVKREGQGFFDFGNFVVVEFKSLGNAAYIYSKSYYKENIEKYTEYPNTRSNTFFKDRNACLDRIIHNGSWQIKTDNIIRRIMRYGH